MHVSEVGESLDPQVTCRGWVIDSSVFAHLHHFLIVVSLDVEVEELLLQAKLLATDFDTLWVVIDLKQEKDVIRVDFGVVVDDELLDRLLEAVGLHVVSRSYLGLGANLLLVHLLQVEVEL